MRIHPLAVLPLLLAFSALVMAGYTSGPAMVLTAGVAAAAVLVGMATLFQYTKPSPEARQVPVENFSLWADVGEPAAELRRLGLGDMGAAVRIASADLGSLVANSELLRARILMLTGKGGFEGLREEKIHRRAENLTHDVKMAIGKMSAASGFSADVLTLLEQCAAQADRIANKLFEFERGKSEVVHIYVDPLRRAAEKLSRDLRLGSANISGFMQGTLPKETGA